LKDVVVAVPDAEQVTGLCVLGTREGGDERRTAPPENMV